MYVVTATRMSLERQECVWPLCIRITVFDDVQERFSRRRSCRLLKRCIFRKYEEMQSFLYLSRAAASQKYELLQLSFFFARRCMH